MHLKSIGKFILLSVFLISKIGFAQVVWENGPFAISLNDNVIEVTKENNVVAQINSIDFNFVKYESIKVLEVKKESVILKLFFTESDGFHDNFPKELLLTISQFNNTFHFYAEHEAFNHITINLKDFDEHYFGLIEKLYPHNSKNPDLRGNVIDVDVYAEGEREYAENYASAYSAFYISSKGYGSFFDTFARGRYHLGINGNTEIYHQTGILDWYLFIGNTGDKIHKEYFDIIGKPKYVPIWGCGPIFWRDYNSGKDEILDDIQKFTDLKIPLTGCFVDRPYSDGGHEWSKMNFSDKFSEPEKWIKTINEKYGLQFMTWVGSLTFWDKDFPGLLPNYKSYIDLTNPEALAEFEKRLVENQYSIGVKGHKMDRADEGFPMAAKWHEPIRESETRNKYAYLYSKVIDDFLTNAHGKDNLNFARSAFHRSQPHLSAIWGGDVRPNWHGMSSNQANAMRSSFQGFPVWGSDVGGYLGEGRIDETLYGRWLQWGAFTGMFEIKIDGAGGSGEDRPPWKYSKQLQNIFKNSCEIRMEFLPYIYSCANTSSSNGVMMKPLAYSYLDDENTYEIWDEYIFGDALLIAPIFTEKNSREIYLPKGKWYDFNNLSIEYEGPQSFTTEVDIESIPIFVKANSIYVTGDIYRGNSNIWKDELKGNEEIRIHLFPGNVSEQTLFQYIDYLDNDNLKEMKLNSNEKKIEFTSSSLSTLATINIKSNSKPLEVLLNGDSINFDYDKSIGIVKVNVDKGEQISLQVILK